MGDLEYYSSKGYKYKQEVTKIMVIVRFLSQEVNIQYK